MAVKMKKANNTNTYFHQLQAHKFLQALSKNNSLTFEDLKLNFTGSLPDSQTLRYIQKQYPEKFFVYKRAGSTSKGKKIITAFTRTTAIIDVAFSDDFKEVLDKPIALYSNNKRIQIAQSYGDVILTASEVYKKFYTEGFYLNGIHYVLLQRSTSKSRLGQTLFVDETMLDNILAWSRMELDFIENEPCDVASLMAYESLTLSGIIGTVSIEPHEILLIDDVKSCFTSIASLTQYDDKKKCLVAIEQDIQQESDIFDGQALLDASKFTGEYQGKGMLLLRNKFFKSCAFNTNIQQWFLNNGITDVLQLNGITLAQSISDIKLITTPNSLKAIRFAYKLGCTKEQEKETMFRYWLRHIDYDFGVVKYEKPSTFGKRNQLSYQMINSLPLSYDNVLSLAQYNIKQIDRINNDFAYFREYIRPSNDGEPNITKDMLYNLCCYNPKIQHAELYKSQRREVVRTLKNHMLNGRLLVEGDYATLVSCPIEMLKSACGIQWESSLHKPYEIHSTMFDDGVELVGFRNPHVASGNVCVFTNKKLHEIETYLNLTRNIVVINAYGNDVLSRLQGADMDSDTCLLTNDSIVLAAAKECTKFATPINGIKGDKQQRYYNKTDIAEVDYIIGQNMIGQIINLSQIFNSYYWDYKEKGATPAQLQTIYDCVSILSSMSQLEIDKAKKFFSLNVASELKKIIGTTFNADKLQALKNERTCLQGKKYRLELKLAQDDLVKVEYDGVCKCLEKNKQKIREFKERNKIIQIEAVQLQKMLLSDADNEAISEYEVDLENGAITAEDYNELVQSKLSYSKDKQVRPSFFRNNSKDKKCKFISFHTPMDFLTQIVSSEIKKASRDRTPMELSQLLLDTPTKNADRKQINKILAIAEGIRDELQFHYLRHKEMAKSKNGKFNYQSYKDGKQILISDGLDSLSTVKISKVETMLLLLQRCYSSSARVKNEATHKYRTTLIGMLYNTHKDLFMACFK